MRRLALLAVIALVPALASAAPRKKKRKAKPKPTTTKPAEPDTEPAPTPDPEPAAAPAATGGPTIPAQHPATTPAAPAPQTPGAPAAPASPEPKAKAAADAKPETTSEPAPDVDALRQEYLALRDELFRSRARVSTVASQLYSTRIQIKLTYTTGRYYNPQKATIRLDGASVYENATGAIASDDGVRFDGYVAPGRHLITFRVEATGKDDDTFTSATESQIVVKAVPGKDLVVAAKAKDSGDIAYAWKRSERGSYGLGIDVAVKTQARADGAKK